MNYFTTLTFNALPFTISLMAKLKNPLLSFNAHNSLSKAITFVRRRGQNIAEKKPEILDVKSTAQLTWRTMFLMARDLWHDLSAAEKRAWESAGSIRHMTGYAWFMSQALRPNPGIYLPLLGGTMQGAIQMADFHIHGLPLPVHVQDVWRRQDFQDFCLPYHMTQGARVYHNIDQAIPNNVPTALAFNSERWDDDTIHDNALSNSRLTCRTAGKYIVTASFVWEELAGGRRQITFYKNGITVVGILEVAADANNRCKLCCCCIQDLSVGEYVEVWVLHTQGAPLDILFIDEYSPEFMMSRVGS